MQSRGETRDVGNGVLLVVGDADERRRLDADLTDCGFAVVAVASGEQASASVAARSPDVIVVEWTTAGDLSWLPRLQDRIEPRPSTVVLLPYRESDPAAEAAERLALEAGADDCVTRPVFVRELSARIALALALRAQEALPDAVPVASHSLQFGGSTHHVAAIDLFRSFARSGATGTLRFRHESQEASFWIRHGRVERGTFGLLVQADAVAGVVALFGATFEAEVEPLIPRGVEPAFHEPVPPSATLAQPPPRRSDAPWSVEHDEALADTELASANLGAQLSFAAAFGQKPLVWAAAASVATFLLASTVTRALAPAAREARTAAAHSDQFETAQDAPKVTATPGRAAADLGEGALPSLASSGNHQPTARDFAILGATEPMPAREAPLETRVVPGNQSPEVRAAERALLVGDMSGAIELAKQAVDHSPGDADGWLTLAAAERAAGNLVASRDAYRSCVAQAHTEGVVHCRVLVEASKADPAFTR